MPDPKEGLKAGRIVYFVFDDQAVNAVTDQRRTSGLVGNTVLTGSIYPAMVVQTWGDTKINLKVMLDGPDTYWATSVEFDAERQPGSWHWMFEGQATRYQPDRVEKVEA